MKASHVRARIPLSIQAVITLHKQKFEADRQVKDDKLSELSEVELTPMEEEDMNHIKCCRMCRSKHTVRWPQVAEEEAG